MSLNTLLYTLKNTPQRVEFEQVMEVIAAHYHYTPTTFRNGDLVNLAATNEGSCKIFSFAQLHQLNVAQTLACFGTYYRQDVLENPQGQDHQNIRHFIIHGFSGIGFEQAPLQAK